MITYILIGMIVLQQIIHHFERKDLYNRIMSRDLKEYKGKETPYVSRHNEVLKRWRQISEH